MNSARILAPTTDNLRLAAERLRAGEVVGMPTETVYGLAAVAFDEAAVAKVFAVKERPRFDPLIVHVADEAAARTDPVAALGALGVVDEAAARPVGLRAAALARAFWPGPLTLVLPRGEAIPDLVTAGLDTVAVRMPRHRVAQALLSRCGFPLAAPSANRFGRISPTSAEDVLAELGDRIELILDGGPAEIGLESTVLALPADEAPPLLLRAGGVPREAIEAIVGPIELASARRAEAGGAPVVESPGLLASHYAPRRPLRLLPGPVGSCPPEGFSSGPAGPIGLLVQAGHAAETEEREARRLGRVVVARSLSASGDLNEKARRLFRCLRELDGSGAVALFAEPCADETGLGHAIADRLRRAAAPRDA